MGQGGITRGRPGGFQTFLLLCIGVGLAVPGQAGADTFERYTLARSFTLPSGAAAFDVLADGRVVTIVPIAPFVDADIYIEDEVQSGTFSFYDSLLYAYIPSFGAAFLRMSPDGAKVAVGNNGGTSSNYKVGVFDFASLVGEWFVADHFDAEWVDDTQLALTAGNIGSPSRVTILDTSSDPANPINPTVIDGIDGASAGIAFDTVDNLYTGNGLSTSHPDGTGAVKAFDDDSWAGPLRGGRVVDFETAGTPIIDILSASPLGFDLEGNLFVGGGDGGSHSDFAALVRASAVTDALDGFGPVDPDDLDMVRRLDPDGASSSDFYWINYNDVTGELYVRDYGSPTVYVYTAETPIPTVSQWGIVGMTLLVLVVGTLIFERTASARVQ